jgi:hypothetical protein
MGTKIKINIKDHLEINQKEKKKNPVEIVYAVIKETIDKCKPMDLSANKFSLSSIK